MKDFKKLITAKTRGDIKYGVFRNIPENSRDEYYSIEQYDDETKTWKPFNNMKWVCDDCDIDSSNIENIEDACYYFNILIYQELSKLIKTSVNDKKQYDIKLDIAQVFKYWDDSFTISKRNVRYSLTVYWSNKSITEYISDDDAKKLIEKLSLIKIREDDEDIYINRRRAEKKLTSLLDKRMRVLSKLDKEISQFGDKISAFPDDVGNSVNTRLQIAKEFNKNE